MIQCSNCNKTFDEKRISGICPYCGNEGGLTLIPSDSQVQSDTKERKPDSSAKNSKGLAIASIVLGIISIVYIFIDPNIFWLIPLATSGLGLFLGIKGIVASKTIAIIGVLLCVFAIFFSLEHTFVGSRKPLDMYNIAQLNFTGEPGVRYSGGKTSVTIVIYGHSTYSTKFGLRMMLGELGFNSSAVTERMYRTRAIDGVLTAESDKAYVTWSYHPDTGLAMVFEAK